MPQTPKVETAKPEARKTEPKSNGAQKNGIDSLLPANFPVNFADLPARNAAMLARANEIMVRTAKAVWENETELFKVESEQARESLAPFKNGKNVGAAFAGYWAQWHENSARLIAHMRAINDLVWACEWQLLELYAENVQAATKHPAA